MAVITRIFVQPLQRISGGAGLRIAIVQTRSAKIRKSQRPGEKIYPSESPYVPGTAGKITDDNPFLHMRGVVQAPGYSGIETSIPRQLPRAANQAHRVLADDIAETITADGDAGDGNWLRKRQCNVVLILLDLK
jgi:hypothetical protein